MSESNVTERKQVVDDYVAWVNGDPAGKAALAESVDVYNPGLPGGEVHSRAAYESYLAEIRTGFPDFQFVAEAVVEGSDTVMVEFTVSGTHEGEFKGLPPTGRVVEIRGIEKFSVTNGDIVECRVYYDTQELTEQLGLTFPTVIGQLPKLAWGKLRASRPGVS